MKKVIIKGRYNTSFGKIIQVLFVDGIIKNGENVKGDDGIVYNVKRVIMPTRPGNNTFGIVYET